MDWAEIVDNVVVIEPKLLNTNAVVLSPINVPNVVDIMTLDVSVLDDVTLLEYMTLVSSSVNKDFINANINKVIVDYDNVKYV